MKSLAMKFTDQIFKTTFGQRGVYTIITITVGLYLLQIFTPLRLNFDSTRLFEMVISYFEGKGFTWNGSPSPLPAGYPMYLAFLEHVGIAGPVAFVASNVLFIFIGMLALDWVARHEFRFSSLERRLLVAGTLLSTFTLKYTTLPLTEALYFGISFLVFRFLLSFPESLSSRWLFAVVSGGLILIAFNVRAIGVVLAPSWLIGSILLIFFKEPTCGFVS